MAAAETETLHECRPMVARRGGTGFGRRRATAAPRPELVLGGAAEEAGR